MKEKSRLIIPIICLAILAIICGCAAPQFEGKYEIYQDQQVNASFTEQYEKMIADWNYIASMKTVQTQQGFLIYFDSRVKFTEQNCNNKMSPTFNCSDVLLETEPIISDLREGDIVSFRIWENESQAFGEEKFSTPEKIIQRRIYRVGNDTSLYFVVKRDSSETTHKYFVRFDRIVGKVIGFIFDAKVVDNPLNAFTSKDKTIAEYNALVENWNSFMRSVYLARMTPEYKIYYDRKIDVPLLACTGSMDPTIGCNDLIFAYKPQNEVEIHAGDVISFRIAPNETSGFLEPPSNETIHVMHRVFRITQSQGQIAFITKGDNPESNKQTDAIYLTFDRIDTKTIAYFKDGFNATYKNK